MTCGACRKPILAAYFELKGTIVCPECAEQIKAEWNAGSAAVRVVLALVFGLVAAIGGGLLWYGVARLTGYEIGLVGIVVGLMVGLAVRRGSAYRGGWSYQAIAMVLTYCAITGSRIPFIINVEPDPVWYAIRLPFESSPPDVIGLLIIGIAVFEAWKINARVELNFAGPFRVGGQSNEPA